MELALIAFALAVPIRAQQTAPSAQAPPTAPIPQASVQAPAPQAPAAGTISVDVNVVNVLAAVRDKKGGIVSNLGQDDFVLQVDQKDHPITYFSRETDLPLSIGLLVDTSLSQRRILGVEREASRGFLDDLLRPDKDKAFVIHFDREVELLQDLTSSRDKLGKALGLLQTPDDQGANGDGQDGPAPGPGRPRYGGLVGTLLYDAVYLASNDVIKNQPGRKVLIVLSDGVDRGSKESLLSAVEAAQRADTVVYAILFADEARPPQFDPFEFPGGRMGRRGGGRRFPDQRPDGRKALEEITKETGGRLFEVSRKESIEQIYAAIEEDMRNEYSIGFAPDAGIGYHSIRLAVKRKDMTVQARDAYYGVN